MTDDFVTFNFKGDNEEQAPRTRRCRLNMLAKHISNLGKVLMET